MAARFFCSWDGASWTKRSQLECLGLVASKMYRTSPLLPRTWNVRAPEFTLEVSISHTKQISQTKNNTVFFHKYHLSINRCWIDAGLTSIPLNIHTNRACAFIWQMSRWLTNAINSQKHPVLIALFWSKLFVCRYVLIYVLQTQLFRDNHNCNTSLSVHTGGQWGLVPQVAGGELEQSSRFLSPPAYWIISICGEFANLTSGIGHPLGYNSHFNY